MKELPAYVRYTSNGYYYCPPEDAVHAGVVKRKWSKELDKVLKAAEAGSIRMAEWRKARAEARAVRKDGRVGGLVSNYLHSLDYAALTSRSKMDYKTGLMAWAKKRIGGVELHNAKIEHLSAPMCQRIYEQAVKETGSLESVYKTVAYYRIAFNWGIRHGYCTFNPFTYVKVKRGKTRKEMWERKHVMAFLNTAFSKWEWRNAGILFYCLYEWGQRVSDILNLKWSQVDLKERMVIITQSKRGATVKLPISDGLHSVLQQQWNDFPCRHLVAPRMRRVGSEWVAYNVLSINAIYHDIAEAAKLPKQLQLRDLRRTAITETIENGADMLTVMMLSGHRSVASVSPYFVHTLKGATKAQEIRQFPDQLIEDVTLDVPRLGYKRKEAYENSH
jgi:integrase